jgi:hypothetical protein
MPVDRRAILTARGPYGLAIVEDGLTLVCSVVAKLKIVELRESDNWVRAVTHKTEGQKGMQ